MALEAQAIVGGGSSIPPPDISCAARAGEYHAGLRASYRPYGSNTVDVSWSGGVADLYYSYDCGASWSLLAPSRAGNWSGSIPSGFNVALLKLQSTQGESEWRDLGYKNKVSFTSAPSSEDGGSTLAWSDGDVSWDGGGDPSTYTYVLRYSADGATNWTDLGDRGHANRVYANAEPGYYQVSVWNGSYVAGQSVIQLSDAHGLVKAKLPTLSASFNKSLSYTMPATAFKNLNGGSLSYSASTPSWLSFDAATRKFTGTPTFANGGKALIPVTASYSRGSVTSILSISVGQAIPDVMNPVSPTPINTGNRSGVSAHQAMVGPLGDARFTLPLQLPAGIQGLRPELAVSYSSLRDRANRETNLWIDSPLHDGWEITGARSALRLCDVADAADTSGADDVIDLLNPEQPWCLDNRRLHRISGNSNLQPGARFMLQDDPFTLIVHNGLNATSDTLGVFTVYRPDGRVQQYAPWQFPNINYSYTGQTLYEALLTTDTHPSGYQAHYWYTNLGGTLENPVISSIYWSGALDAKVAFAYELVGGADAIDFGDVSLAQDARLHTIYVGGGSYPLIREYVFEGNVSGITSLQECSYDEAGQQRSCLEPFVFTYTGGKLNSVTDAHGRVTAYTYGAPAFTEKPFGTLSPPAGSVTTSSDGLVSEMAQSDGPAYLRTWEYAYQGGFHEGQYNEGFYGALARRVTDSVTGKVTYTRQQPGKPLLHAASKTYDGNYGSHTEVIASAFTNYTALATYPDWIDLPSFENTVYMTVPARSVSIEYEKNNVAAVEESVYDYHQDWYTNFLLGSSVTTRTAQTISGLAANAASLGSATLSGISSTRASSHDYESIGSYDSNWWPDPSGGWSHGFVTGRTARTFKGNRAELEGDFNESRVREGATQQPAEIHRNWGKADYQEIVSLTRGVNMNLLTRQETSATQSTSTSYGGYEVDAQQTLPTEVINALNQTSYRNYDSRFGKVRQLTDANGQTRSLSYDGSGRLASFTNSDGVTTSRVEESCAQLSCTAVYGVAPATREQVTSPISPTVNRYRDGRGRLLREEKATDDGSWRRTDYAYDDAGRISQRSSPYLAGDSFATTSYQYDARGRVTLVTRPDGSSTATSYGFDGGTGQRTETITENVIAADNSAAGSIASKRFFNAGGQLVKVIQGYGSANALTTEYAYNSLGAIEQITAPGNAVASFEYDDQGNLVKHTDTGGRTSEYAYNHNNQVRWHKDPDGTETTYTYDALGRIKIEIVGSQIFTWSYDTGNGVGSIATVTSNSGFTRSHTYNDQGKLQRVATEIKAGGFNKTLNVDYAYDAQGRLESVTYPSGYQVDYTYQNGYLYELRDATSGNLIERYDSRDAFGLITDITYGNNVHTDYIRDPLHGRMLSVNTQRSGITLQDRKYGWRSDGTLEFRVKDNWNTQRETYTYDSLGRVTTSETRLNNLAVRTQTTAYDNNGRVDANTSSIATDEQTIAINHGSGSAGVDQVSSKIRNGINVTITYDADGRRRKEDAATGDDTWYTYDIAGRLIKITTGSSETTATPTARTEYSYGPGGVVYYKKITRTIDARVYVTHHFYAGGTEERELEGFDDLKRVLQDTVSANSVHISSWDIAGVKRVDLQHVHRDQLGSAEVVTNASGVKVQEFSLDRLGKQIQSDWAGQVAPQELKGQFITHQTVASFAQVNASSVGNVNFGIFDEQSVSGNTCISGNFMAAGCELGYVDAFARTRSFQSWVSSYSGGMTQPNWNNSLNPYDENFPCNTADLVGSCEWYYENVVCLTGICTDDNYSDHFTYSAQLTAEYCRQNPEREECADNSSKRQVEGSNNSPVASSICAMRGAVMGYGNTGTFLTGSGDLIVTTGQWPDSIIHGQLFRYEFESKPAGWDGLWMSGIYEGYNTPTPNRLFGDDNFSEWLWTFHIPNTEKTCDNCGAPIITVCEVVE